MKRRKWWIIALSLALLVACVVWLRHSTLARPASSAKVEKVQVDKDGVAIAAIMALKTHPKPWSKAQEEPRFLKIDNQDPSGIVLQEVSDRWHKFLPYSKWAVAKDAASRGEVVSLWIHAPDAQGKVKVRFSIGPGFGSLTLAESGVAWQVVGYGPTAMP
jgi:hypothetical protein